MKRFMTVAVVLLLAGCVTSLRHPDTGETIPASEAIPVDVDGDATPDHFTDIEGTVLEEHRELDAGKVAAAGESIVPLIPGLPGDILRLGLPFLTLVINKRKVK